MKLMGDSLETLGAADMDSEIDAANWWQYVVLVFISARATSSDATNTNGQQKLWLDLVLYIDSRGVKEARNQMVVVIYSLTRKIAGNSRLLPAVKWSFDDFLRMQMAK